MPKYKCNNQNCKNLNEVFEIGSTRISYNKLGERIDTAAPCPVCNEIRELVPYEGMTTVMLGSNNICKK